MSARIEKAREALGLLRSIILSGEPWTPSAEATFAAALAEVGEWEARYEATEAAYEAQREYADVQYRKRLAAEAERDRLAYALDLIPHAVSFDAAKEVARAALATDEVRTKGVMLPSNECLKREQTGDE